MTQELERTDVCKYLDVLGIRDNVEKEANRFGLSADDVIVNRVGPDEDFQHYEVLCGVVNTQTGQTEPFELARLAANGHTIADMETLHPELGDGLFHEERPENLEEPEGLEA